MQNFFLVVYSLFFFAATIYTGKAFLKLIGLRLNNRVEWLLFSFGFGSFLYSTIFILLGFLHLLYKPILLLLYFIPVIFMLKDIVKRSRIGGNARKANIKLNLINYSLILLIIFILYPLVPSLFNYPTSWDPLAYHLVLPKLYLSEHTFNYYRSFPQTGFPIGIESLFGFGEIFKEPRFATILNFSFILSIFVYILFGLRYMFGLIPTILASIFFGFDSALYSEISVTPFVDYPFAFFCLFLSISLVNFFQTKKSVWLIPIICFGLFLSIIKFSGIVILLFLLLTLVAFAFINRKKLDQTFSIIRKKRSLFILIIFAAAITPLLWYTKNYLQIHNPFYPFLDNVFKGTEYSPSHGGGILDEIRGINWLYATTKFNILHEIDNLTDYINLSVILTFLALIIFSIVSFFRHKKFRWINLFALLSLLGITLFVGPLRRYYLPIAPILTLIASYTVYDLFKDKKHKFINFIVVCVFLFVLVTQIDVVFNSKNNFFGNRPKLAWIKGFDVNANHKGLFMQDNYAMIDFINKHLKKEDKVLSLFDNRLYYFDIPVEYENPTAHGHFTDLTIKTSSEIYKRIKNEGFTYVLINKNWGEPADLRKDLLNKFIKNYLKPVHFIENPGGGGLFLYKLK